MKSKDPLHLKKFECLIHGCNEDWGKFECCSEIYSECLSKSLPGCEHSYFWLYNNPAKLVTSKKLGSTFLIDFFSHSWKKNIPVETSTWRGVFYFFNKNTWEARDYYQLKCTSVNLEPSDGSLKVRRQDFYYWMGMVTHPQPIIYYACIMSFSVISCPFSAIQTIFSSIDDYDKHPPTTYAWRWFFTYRS